jgi:hypothetical protein
MRYAILGKGAVGIILVLVLSGSVLIVSVRESQAIPAWARKYNADCMMCHYPVVPRLNSFGQQFRRAGYRTPPEFNKDQDVTKVGNFLAARMRTQFAYQNTKGTIERSEFRDPDVSFFYAGAISRNFSGYLHAFGDGTSVDLHGHLQAVYGSANRFVSLRIGQMHMLLQEGIGGFDRPTGITTSPVQSLALTRSAKPMVFNFDQRQKGVELAYVQGPGRLLVQVSNGLDETGSGTSHKFDIDPQKDVLVAYDHILDEIASGFTLFYYNGTTHGVATLNAAGQPTAISQASAFSRFGANISKILPLPGFGFFEVQGGYIRSYDNVPVQVGPDVQGNAYYLESQQYVTGPELTFYERYSSIDLDGPRPNSTRKDYTFGVVTPVQTWFRVTGEYTYTDNRFTGITGHIALVELQGNW